MDSLLNIVHVDPDFSSVFQSKTTSMDGCSTVMDLGLNWIGLDIRARVIIEHLTVLIKLTFFV